MNSLRTLLRSLLLPATAVAVLNFASCTYAPPIGYRTAYSDSGYAAPIDGKGAVTPPPVETAPAYTPAPAPYYSTYQAPYYRPYYSAYALAPLVAAAAYYAYPCYGGGHYSGWCGGGYGGYGGYGGHFHGGWGGHHCH